uniref:ACT domain-containing protein n=1 Tax=Hyaloperonospora arabidopsidis (strain Emoy2) TaxID=559515 RepID=M4BCU3_HYAAE
MYARRRLASIICSRVHSSPRLSSRLPSALAAFTLSTTCSQPDALDERIISLLVVNRPGTLAHIAKVFTYAEKNITSLCVRSTVVPELSRVTIACFLHDNELPAVKARLGALVTVTFFHVTSVPFCVLNNQLLLRSQLLLQIRRNPRQQCQLQKILHAFHAELIVPDDEQDAEKDESLLAMDYNNDDDDEEEEDDNHNEENEEINDGRSEALTTQFLALVDEPKRLTLFIETLLDKGFEILETQTCGPLFLDSSHSTLDPESVTSFRRKVALEVEKLLSDVATNGDATSRDFATTEQTVQAGKGHGREDTALMLRRLNEDYKDIEVESGAEADRLVDAGVITPVLPTSTFQLHTNERGCFSANRLELHARIAQQLYASVPQDVAVPKFVLLLGIPGAGKSTMLSHLDLVGQLTLQDYVNFDIDDVIALLPEFYHAMLNVGLGNDPESRSVTNLYAAKVHSKRVAKLLPKPQTRYQLCRDEARFIIKKNLDSAIMSRKNILLHGSGKSFASYARTVDQVKAAGFDVHVICLDIPTAEAYKRVDKRSRGYGRDVPRLVIDTASSLITQNFRRLANRVPNAHLFDSMEIPPRLVWSKQQSETVTEHPDDDVQRKYGIK